MMNLPYRVANFHPQNEGGVMLPARIKAVSILVLASFTPLAIAQSPSYAPDITLANAKKIAAAGLAEAQKNN
jgi:hypothetical protein